MIMSPSVYIFNTHVVKVTHEQYYNVDTSSYTSITQSHKVIKMKTEGYVQYSRSRRICSRDVNSTNLKFLQMCKAKSKILVSA